MRYQVKIRFQGHISWVEVDANGSDQAKALVRQQYGEQVTVLNVKMADKKRTGSVRLYRSEGEEAMPNFEVKSFKSQRGHEGPGFTASFGWTA